MSEIEPVRTHESIPISVHSKETTERENAFQVFEEDQTDGDRQPRSRLKLIAIMVALNVCLLSHTSDPPQPNVS